MTMTERLQSIKRFDLLKILKILFFSVAIIYNSGYALVTVYSRSVNILILAALAFVLICLVLIEKRYKKTIQPIPLIFFVTMMVLLVFSTCLNFSSAELVYAIRFALILLNSYLFTLCVDFKSISYYFRKIMFGLSIISLLGFFIVFVAKFSLYRYFPTVINVNEVTYYNGLILFFGGHAPTVLVRNFGVFWEPGIHGSYLLIAMFLQVIADKDRIHWVRQIVFTLTLITTFSTASITLLPLVFLAYALRNKKKQFGQTAFVITLCIMIVVLLTNLDTIKPYLAETFPSIFGKLINATGSGDTRLYSPLANWDILKNNHFVGLGFNKVDLLYAPAIQQYVSYGAQTSTSFYFMAVLGPLGILYSLAFVYGIFKQKSLSFYTRICLIVTVLIIVNKEPHTYFLFTYLILFYSLVPNAFAYETSEYKEIQEHKAEKERTKRVDEDAFSYRLKRAIFANRFAIKIKNVFSKSKDNRTLATNIVSTFGIKGVALIISLLSTPAYARYFANDTPEGIVVGVWFTLISVFSWILNFDFGIGNGLRNKLVKAFVRKDKQNQKELISSGYIILGLISLIVLVGGCIAIPFLNWNKLLNISSDFLNSQALIFSVLIVFSGIILQFFLKLITSILYALQKTALASLLTLTSSITLLLYLLIARGRIADNNTAMIALSVAQIVTVNLPLLIATIVVFAFVLKDVRPNRKFYRKDCAKEVTSLGMEFFAIQICLLVISSTNEILITRLYAPNYVTEYTYYNKWFHMVSMLFTLLVQPMWSSVSKSYEQKDYRRIKKIFQIFNVLAGLFVAGSILLSLILQPIMDIWLKEHSIKVEFLTCLSFVLMIGASLFSTSATCIANGTNKLKCQIICCSIGALLKIPITILVTKVFHAGWSSVIYIQALMMLPLTIAQPILVNRYLNKKINEQKGMIV